MVGRMSIMVLPALASHTGVELAKEAAITKGRVNAHELRVQLKKCNSAGGGGQNKKKEGELAPLKSEQEELNIAREGTLAALR